MKLKKIISILLSTAIITSAIPVISFAEDNDTVDINELMNDEEFSHKAEYTGKDIEATQEPSVNEPKEYEYTVPDTFAAEDMANTKTVESISDKQNSMARAATASALDWSTVFSDQFGDAYLSPYKKSSGTSVSGLSNRLTIYETDLTLAGKNGLDVNIRRKYDNQAYSEEYIAKKGDLAAGEYYDISNRYYIYGFTNTSDNTTVYVGFPTRDDFHIYMENGITIGTLPKRWTRVEISNVSYYIYFFHQIYDQRKDTGITLKYNPDIPVMTKRINRIATTKYELLDVGVLSNNSLGNNWNMEIPQSAIVQESKTVNDARTVLKYDFIGAFRNLEGEVYHYTGVGTYKVNEVTGNTYTSIYHSKDNDFLEFIPYFETQVLDGPDIEYNFIINDHQNGHRYYFYNTGIGKSGIGNRQILRTVAIKDRYDNMIQYKYDSSYNLTSIIDTYGRVISISKQDNSTDISYTDEANEVKHITYTKETLAASALDNDSPLKSKEVDRFKVTNALGETTVYDSRKTEVISYYCASETVNPYAIPGIYGDLAEVSTGSNIERIIYPTGVESRYRYKLMYLGNAGAKVAHSVYAVEDEYDIIGNTTKNHNEYSYEVVTSTSINKTKKDIARNSINIQNYRRNGLLQKSTTSETGTTSSKPYVVETYKYNEDDRQPEYVSVNNSGVTTTKTSEYNTWYPGAIAWEIQGDKKITYSYHRIDGHRTGIPEVISYQYKSGSEYVTDYSEVTTLTADNKSIDKVQIVKDNRIEYQKQYEYDDCGRVTAIKEWISDSNNDKVLDDNDKILKVNSAYTVDGACVIVTDSVASVTDADGNTTDGISTTYVYTPTGKPYKMTDPKGNTTTVTYDGAGKIKKITYPNNSYEQFDYDSSKHMVNIRDRANNWIWTYHDGAGNPTSRYFSNNGWTKFEDCKYDSSGRLSVKVTNTDGGKSIKEAYTYDIFDRPVSKTVTYNSEKLYTENYEYTTSGSNSIVSKSTTAEDGTVSAAEKLTYDNLGRMVKKELGSGDGKMTYDYTYDYKGNMLSETDGKGNKTEYKYNYNNDVTQTTHPDHIITANYYDMANRRFAYLNKNWDTSRYYYDELNRLIKTTAPLERSGRDYTAKKYYDGNSNVIRESVRNNVISSTGEDTFNTTEYTYDKMNNLIGVTTGDTAVQYWYDTAGRKTAMATGLSSVKPNGGIPSTGSVTKYEYGMRSYLTKETDALNQSVTYTHDYNGNVKTLTDRNGTVTTNTYGPYGITEAAITDGNTTEKYSYTYNKLGWQTEVKLYNDGTLKDTVTNTYDEFGRVLTADSNGRTNHYSYDQNSNVTAYKLTKGEIAEISNNYTYDVVNNLTEADLNGTMVIYEYDDAGYLTKKSIGDNVTTISYNQGNMIKKYETKVGDNVINSYEYTYRADGNRVTDNDTVHNINKAYQYDDMGHLVSESISGSTNRISSYTYDKRGNRLTETVSGGKNYTVTSTYDVNNRLTNQVRTDNGTESANINYYYDANGNQTYKQTLKYGQGGLVEVDSNAANSTVEEFKYNLQNQLTKYKGNATTTYYTYGANGLRKSKQVTGSQKKDFVWDGMNLVAELRGGTTAEKYTYGVDGITTRTESDGYVTVYNKNAHGDVVGLWYAQDNDTSKYVYDAFGNQLEADADTNPFRYCGEYYDSESGNIYLRARYYDSSNGRFINEDPIKDGLNWYSYCSGNPIGFVDPLGLAMQITDDGDSREYFIDYLNFLTEWNINVDEDGMVSLKDENKESKYPVGNELIKKLIESDSLITISGRSDGEAKTTPNKDGDIIGADITMDVKSSYGSAMWDYETESTQYKNVPNCVVLAHELIHSYDIITGSYEVKETGVYRYVDQYKNIREEEAVIEELKAAGFDYVNSKGEIVYGSSHEFTENAIRREHGIGDRISFR